MLRYPAPSQTELPYAQTLARFLVQKVLNHAYGRELELSVRVLPPKANKNVSIQCTVMNDSDDRWFADIELTRTGDMFYTALIWCETRNMLSPITVFSEGKRDHGYAFTATYTGNTADFKFEVVTEI